MALIAHFATTSEVARASLNTAPDMTLRHEVIYRTDDGLVWGCWGSGDNVRGFEAALRSDPTILSYDVLTDHHDRRLYELTLAGRADDFVYGTMTELGVQLLDITHSIHHTLGRVRCPSREVYKQLCTAWEERCGHVATRQLFAEYRDDAPTHGITPKQWDVLRLAAERGYFSVPRQVELCELAAELDISETAASQRIRRGVDSLVTDVCTEGSDTHWGT